MDVSANGVTVLDAFTSITGSCRHDGINLQPLRNLVQNNWWLNLLYELYCVGAAYEHSIRF